MTLHRSVKVLGSLDLPLVASELLYFPSLLPTITESFEEQLGDRDSLVEGVEPWPEN